MSIITEKKRLFKELNIPWSNQIEKEYKAYKKENGEAKAETLYDYVIQKEIGKYAMAELIKANLIECCGSYKGAKLYAI